jgi:hypothetical protein
MDAQAVSVWLCDLLRADADAAAEEALAHLSPSDWEVIVEVLRCQGLLPLLHHHLKAWDLAGLVPGNVWQELQEGTRFNAARNATLNHGLAEVLAALEEGDIPVILLKGAHLANFVYDSIALRYMGDVDLLVRREDLTAVVKRFAALGYGPAGGSGQPAADVETHHLPVLTKRDAPGFELHWQIVRLVSPDRRMDTPFQVDLEGLWARARPASIDTARALVLSPEDLLLHLCVHLVEHRFRIGPWAYCDIAQVIRHHGGDLDWVQVQERARRWRAERCVYLTLRLARELLGAAVPDEVLEALEPEALDPQVTVWAREQTIASFSGGELPDLHNLARVGEADGLRDKFGTLLRIVFPAPKALAAIYGLPPSSRRVALYYPRRMWDLLLKYGRVSWRLLRGDREVVAAAGWESNANALWEWLTSG